LQLFSGLIGAFGMDLEKAHYLWRANHGLRW